MNTITELLNFGKTVMNETLNFVNKRKNNTNATDMLIMPS